MSELYPIKKLIIFMIYNYFKKSYLVKDVYTHIDNYLA